MNTTKVLTNNIADMLVDYLMLLKYIKHQPIQL